MRTASIYTLGCRLNQADSALVAGELSASGYEIMPWGKATDLIVINGCTVTGVASQKTRQAVRAARKRLPNAFIVLMGCEATVAKPDKYPEANLIVPNPRSDTIPNLIQAQIKLAPPAKPVDDFTLDGVGLYEERTRANLKIQEGCDFSHILHRAHTRDQRDPGIRRRPARSALVACDTRTRACRANIPPTQPRRRSRRPHPGTPGDR